MFKEAMNDMMLDQVSGGDIHFYLPDGAPMPTNLHLYNNTMPGDNDPSKWIPVDLTKVMHEVDITNKGMKAIDLTKYDWPICRGYTG